MSDATQHDLEHARLQERLDDLEDELTSVRDQIRYGRFAPLAQLARRLT